MLKLGERLKELRIRNGQTQEQLAEVFGVSPQAVSRWENRSTYPDITLLPTIANYFDITTDELLGVDIEKRQQEIDKILEYNTKLHRHGKIAESVAFLREKINLYPKSSVIAYQLAHSLYQNLCNEHSKQEDVLNEVISITEKAIHLDKGESYVTFAGKHQLCLAYCMLGRRDEAYEIAVNMPSLWVSREIMLPRTLDNDMEINQRQHNLLTFMDLSILNLHHLSRKMNTPEKSIEVLKKAVSLAELMTGDNHKFYSERVFKCYLWIARNYCAMGKADSALENLENAFRYAEMFEERPEKSGYNAFWLDGYVDDKSKTSKNSEETLYQHLLVKIEEEPFALLHNNDKYMRFIKKVRSKM